MQYTTNYQFKKPEPTDTVNVNDFNDSFDLVDSTLKSVSDTNENLDATFQQLIIAAGTSNAEIVAARVKADNTTYATVGARMNELDSELAEIVDEKATKVEVAVERARIDLLKTSAGDYYVKCLSTDTGALLIVTSGATVGQINLASVSPKLDTYTPVAGDYVRLVSNGLTAETTDIRVGVDGKTYPSAGEAVRGQVIEIRDGLFEEINTQYYDTASSETYTATPTSKALIFNQLLKKGTITKLTLKCLTAGNMYIRLYHKDSNTQFTQIYTTYYALTVGENVIDVKIPFENCYLGFYSPTAKIGYSLTNKGCDLLIQTAVNGSIVTVTESFSNGTVTFNYIYEKSRCDTLDEKTSLTNDNLYLLFSNNAVLVVNKNHPNAYQTINAALAKAYTIESANNPITILIFPGVYKEVCNVYGGRHISLIGINKKDCIVRYDSGAYLQAPIRMQGDGVIKNLTIIATHDDNPTYVDNITDSYNYGSYAVHADDVNTDTASDHYFEIENCDLYSYQNSALGLGMQENTTVRLKNNNFYKIITSEIRAKAPLNSARGAVLIHGKWLANPHSTRQTLIAEGNRLETNLGVVLYLEDSNGDAGLTYQFYTNSLYSKELGVTGIVTNLTSATIRADSYGNNVAALNA